MIVRQIAETPDQLSPFLVAPDRIEEGHPTPPVLAIHQHRLTGSREEEGLVAHEREHRLGLILIVNNRLGLHHLVGRRRRWIAGRRAQQATDGNYQSERTRTD